MLDEHWLMGLARVTVFALMLLNGLTIPVRDLFSLQRKPALLMRSMVAVIVLVPGVVLVILMLVELPVEVATGLAFATGHRSAKREVGSGSKRGARNLRRLPENRIPDREALSFAFKERRQEHSRAM